MQKLIKTLIFAGCLSGLLLAGILPKRNKTPQKSALDEYLDTARKPLPGMAPSPGSTFVPGSLMADLGRDFRANRAGDVVTIVVSDTANAINKGATTTSRKSAASGGITSLFGKLATTNRLANLENMTGNSSLAGTATTSRSNTLTTTVAARVTEVLPGGNLVIEGTKVIIANSERQVVQVRGVARASDVTSTNQIPSTRLAQLEVKVVGKGVVEDAVRRPNIVYRVLLGLLPF